MTTVEDINRLVDTIVAEYGQATIVVIREAYNKALVITRTLEVLVREIERIQVEAVKEDVERERAKVWIVEQMDKARKALKEMNRK